MRSGASPGSPRRGLELVRAEADAAEHPVAMVDHPRARAVERHVGRAVADSRPRDNAVGRRRDAHDSARPGRLRPTPSRRRSRCCTQPRRATARASTSFAGGPVDAVERRARVERPDRAEAGRDGDRRPARAEATSCAFPVVVSTRITRDCSLHATHADLPCDASVIVGQYGPAAAQTVQRSRAREAGAGRLARQDEHCRRGSTTACTAAIVGDRGARVAGFATTFASFRPCTSSRSVDRPGRADVRHAPIPCEVFGLDRSDIVDPLVRVPARRSRQAAGATRRRVSLIEAPARARRARARRHDRRPGLVRPRRRAVRRTLKEALIAAHARGARLVSLCTGAFVLAATGLLDDRRVTTHWMYVDAPAAPATRACESTCDVLYVADDRVTDLGGDGRRNRPLPAPRRARPRARRSPPSRARLVMPLYRAGGQAQYVDTPIADDPRGLARPARLGAARTSAPASPSTTSTARRDEQTHADPPLHGRRSACRRRVAETRAAPPRSAPARADGRSGSSSWRAARLRRGGHHEGAVRRPSRYRRRARIGGCFAATRRADPPVARGSGSTAAGRPGRR